MSLHVRENFSIQRTFKHFGLRLIFNINLLRMRKNGHFLNSCQILNWKFEIIVAKFLCDYEIW